MNRFIKQFTSYTLALLMLLPMICIIPVAALDNTCTISVSAVSANRGDTVEVKVNLSAGSGMQACDFHLNYDPDVLELVSCAKGKSLSASPIINQNSLGKIVFSYAATSAINSSVTLLELAFRVKTDAAYGVSSLDLQLKEISNGSFETIAAAVRSGSVTVLAPQPEAPAGLRIEELEDTYAMIRWDSANDATGYNVYLNGVLFNEEVLEDPICTFFFLEEKTTYTVQVAAVNYTTESPKSESLVFTTDASRYAVVFADSTYGTDDFQESDVIDVQYVVGGASAVPPQAPEKAGYIFDSWEGNYTNVTEGVVIIARYVKEQHTVTFLSYDGTVLDTQSVAHGEAANAPQAPARANYTFDGWDQPFDNVTSDLTVTARYVLNTCQHVHTRIQNATASTCTVHGYSGDTFCVDCEEIIAMGEDLPLKPHTYDNDQDTTCNVCGFVREIAQPVPADAAQIVAESKTAKKGDSFDLTISLKNNPGLASLKLKVAFDADLTLTGVTYNSALGGQSMQPQKPDSPVTLNWYNGAADLNGDPVFATLTFTVSETAVEGDHAITLSYDADDVYNIAEENVEFAVVNGTVEVINYIPGDINADSKVNNKDLTRLFQYLSDWDVEVDGHALDVNGDGKVNNKDLTRLFQYLSDWDVEIF